MVTENESQSNWIYEIDVWIEIMFACLNAQEVAIGKQNLFYGVNDNE